MNDIIERRNDNIIAIQTLQGLIAEKGFQITVREKDQEIDIWTLARAQGALIRAVKDHRGYDLSLECSAHPTVEQLLESFVQLHELSCLSTIH